MRSQQKRLLAMLTVAFGLGAWSAAACFAQPAATAEVAIRAEAFVGQPFGVGRVELDLPPSLRPEVLGIAGLGVSDKDGRVLYPAVQRRPIGEALRNLSEQAPRVGGRLGNVLNRAAGVGGLVGSMLDRSPKVTIYFLFRGDAPLEMTIQSQKSDVIALTPVSNPDAHQRLLALWWREYSAPPGLLQKTDDYPPLVENYLKAMLARRLSLALPRLQTERSWQNQLEENLGLGAGNESIRLSAERDRFLGPPVLREAADQPLPDPINPPEMELPEIADKVEVEPLAQRVPAECFYVRFGSFSNFLWLQDLLAQWGGDMQNLVAQRGLNQEVRARIERQLVLQSTVLARLLGDTVIADVAIVGTDFFFAEGGSFGILFQARNNVLLQSDMKRQRADRVGKNGVTETKVTIDGREASLLSSPDGSVRSYYVAQGDYHFITTSKTLARRFLETRSGKGSLGATSGFRHARSRMPTARKDTIFVYLSDPFFRNFTGPQYRVEMIRRLQAQADLELVELAQLASATEGKPGETIEQLVAGGFLPPDFGPRPDGSRTLIQGEEAVDSLRGHRGWFVPVPDVPVTQVSRAETEAYREFAAYYQSQWQRLDPVLVGLKRKAMPGNQEEIVIDVQMTPFSKQNFERLTQRVGAPDRMQLAPIANDAIAMEVVLPQQRMFGGLWSVGGPADGGAGREALFGAVRNLLVGYVGTTGEPGFLLGLLNLRITARPDANGYALSQGGLWRRQLDAFTVFSFQQDVLATVTSELRFVEAERPAQLRLRIIDLSNARIRPFLNSLAYARTRATSLGNLRLMHSMAQQLHVPGENGKAAAEAVLDARLIDPLGGQYVYRQTPGAPGAWTTTALESAGEASPLGRQAPEGYQSPPLNWLRGLDMDAQLAPAALSAHIRVLMQMPAKAAQ